jgi:hypothetical protein
VCTSPLANKKHGVYPIAHPLGLDYTRLKKRLGGFLTFRRKATKPTFVELVAPSRAQLEECVIDFESSGGGKMRIQWKATAPPDWTALLRALRTLYQAGGAAPEECVVL